MHKNLAHLIPSDHAVSNAQFELERQVTIISKLREQEALIAECTSMPQLQEWQSLTQAVRTYAQEKHLGDELINWATRISVKIQRRIGELLIATREKRNKGGEWMKRKNTTCYPSAQVVPTIPQIGLTRRQSANGQVLAAIPEKELDALMDKQETETGKITKKAILKEARARRAQGYYKRSPEILGNIRKAVSEREKRRRQNIKPQPLDPIEKRFEKYWIEEQRLLNRYFILNDFEKLAELIRARLLQHLKERTELLANRGFHINPIQTNTQ